MKLHIRTLILLFLSAFIITSCGGSSSPSSSPGSSGGGTPDFGSVTFSGTGAVEIATGTTFAPTLGYSALGSANGTWGQGTGATSTTILYSEGTSTGSFTYALFVSSGAGVSGWEVQSATPLTGVSFNTTTKSLTLTNVSIQGLNSSTGNASTLTLNGTLKTL